MNSSHRTRHSTPILLLLLVAFSLPILPGCGGCSSQPAQPKTEEDLRREEEMRTSKKEEPKPPLESPELAILPSTMLMETRDIDEDFSDVRARVAVKPGHWVIARYKLKANNEDFKGILETTCVDSDRNAFDLEKSSFNMKSRRPIVLPKGQDKFVELPVFIGVPTNRKRKTVHLSTNIESRGAGPSLPYHDAITVRMAPHQYHLHVIAREPDRYGYLKLLATVRPPIDEINMTGLREDYVVSLPLMEDATRLPLPGNSLAWTSIAYVFWDDVEAERLSADQQVALVDWLHWGGQLIISGPDSLDLIRDSFLKDYLPVAADGVTTASAAALQEVNDNWSLIPAKAGDDQARFRLSSSSSQPLEIVDWKLQANGRFTPGTGDLVAEQRVGRGRVVVTAFDLGDRHITDWGNIDGFLNGCLLRRPARQFFRIEEHMYPGCRWTNNRKRGTSMHTCGLRYFSRDAAIPGEQYQMRRSLDEEMQSSEDAMSIEERARRRERERREANDRCKTQQESDAGDSNVAPQNWGANTIGERVTGYRNDAVSGVGGWHDFSAAANLARRSLKSAAGIEIPDANFVARLLLGYLAILVPLNWLLFRLIGKVEWAWFAAPLIAIAGAVAVVKLAQLDIGFARSRTEIAVVECQSGYDRAHVTRYAGLYTSLTSDYSAKFEDSNAFALPFSTDPGLDQLRLMRRRQVTYARDKDVGLAGYPVLSNSTGMLHAEQVVEMGGAIELISTGSGGDEDDFSDASVVNNSVWPLQRVAVVRRDDDGVRLAVTDELGVGETVSLSWLPLGKVDALVEMLDDDPITSLRSPRGEVNLRQLYRLGLHASQLSVGDMRLVGWSDQPVEGMVLTPTSSQETFRTLVVANLRYDSQPRPEVDKNHLFDFQKEKTKDEFEIE